MSSTVYLTTTLPYVNADPHIGFALELVQADAYCRTMQQWGDTVIFNTGTDEHGQKIYQKAQSLGKDPQAYCDEYAAKFQHLRSALNLSYTHFIRTTDPRHKRAAQEFWNRCLASGDIYKQFYHIKYCVGCEMEKTDSDLSEDGRCPLHPTSPLQQIDEENYFFRFSHYQQKLLELYDRKDFILPEEKRTEISNFVRAGLQDFSISRLKAKMPWGIPVPSDDQQVMYVWFDALINYISTLGWPDDLGLFQSAWPGIQVAGKDNLRQQTAIWQAMLLSAGLPTSKQVIIHGFITANGQKMSKSLGNVINPLDLVGQFGTDAVRYYLLREIPNLGDGDFSLNRMYELYNADLANELGNLCSRVTTLAAADALEHDLSGFRPDPHDREQILSFKFNEVLADINLLVKSANKQINDHAPWSKTPEERRSLLMDALARLGTIATRLEPFLPETVQRIRASIQGKVVKIGPLFPRIKQSA